MQDLLLADSEYTGPPLTEEDVRRAEAKLGRRLPPSYVQLLLQCNGGKLSRRCFPTSFNTSWAEGYFEVQAIRGIGGLWGIDSDSGLGSTDMISEWGYPDIGIVICDMPSGGHDAVMLDYSKYGRFQEPVVVYVDEDRIARRIADTFAEFAQKLVTRKDITPRA